MAREFIAPGNIFTGAGALDMAEDKLSQLGKKALIVTDNVMVELGNCAKVEAALKNGNVDYVVYHEINGEPTDVTVSYTHLYRPPHLLYNMIRKGEKIEKEYAYTDISIKTKYNL